MVKRTEKAIEVRNQFGTCSTSKPPAVMDNTGKIIDAIIRAASDPAVDVIKMERLLAMKDQMEARAAKIAYDDALSQMQIELPIIKRNGQIVIRAKDKEGERTGGVLQKTKYALWEDINEEILPILHKYGFSLSFRTPVDPSGRISVTGVLARAGHREETTVSYQHDTTGSKNAAQAINSSISYGQRKTACLLLNITSRGEDDDAKKSEGLEPISQAKLAELIKLADQAGADKARFCALLKVDSMADIPKLRYEEAKAQLMRKLRDKQARAKAKAASDFPGDRPL